ncbi:hypothetical protein J6590_049188 [Homalodisca vitripennis]|nr:hypothetical protein J6590_049188 [Homalodisca vitripennis]
MHTEQLPSIHFCSITKKAFSLAVTILASTDADALSTAPQTRHLPLTTDEFLMHMKNGAIKPGGEKEWGWRGPSCQLQIARKSEPFRTEVAISRMYRVCQEFSGFIGTYFSALPPLFLSAWLDRPILHICMRISSNYSATAHVVTDETPPSTHTYCAAAHVVTDETPPSTYCAAAHVVTDETPPSTYCAAAHVVTDETPPSTYSAAAHVVTDETPPSTYSAAAHVVTDETSPSTYCAAAHCVKMNLSNIASGQQRGFICSTADNIRPVQARKIVVSIHGPLGYGPSTLPLRQSAYYALRNCISPVSGEGCLKCHTFVVLKDS